MTTARTVLSRLGLVVLGLVLLVGFTRSPGGPTCGTVFAHDTAAFDAVCGAARQPWSIGLGLLAGLGAVLLVVAWTLPQDARRAAPVTHQG